MHNTVSGFVADGFHFIDLKEVESGAMWGDGTLLDPTYGRTSNDVGNAYFVIYQSNFNDAYDMDDKYKCLCQMLR